MTTAEAFKKIMDEQTEIALATSVEDVPNVRIVSFFYDELKKCLFFSTFRGNEKIIEFQKILMSHLQRFQLKIRIMFVFIMLK